MQSEYRLELLKRIEENEKACLWDKDVEDDPETLPLLPNKVDYLGKKLSSKILTKISNLLAVKFYEEQIKDGYMVIKDNQVLEINGVFKFSSSHQN